MYTERWQSYSLRDDNPIFWEMKNHLYILINDNQPYVLTDDNIILRGDNQPYTLTGSNHIPWQMTILCSDTWQPTLYPEVIRNLKPLHMTTLYNDIMTTLYSERGQSHTLTEDNTIPLQMTTQYTKRWQPYMLTDDNSVFWQMTLLYPDRCQRYNMTENNPVPWEMTNLYPDWWQETLYSVRWQRYTLKVDNLIPWQIKTNPVPR